VNPVFQFQCRHTLLLVLGSPLGQKVVAPGGAIQTATLKLLRGSSKAKLARNTLTDAAKWNHNGSILDGECRAHNVDIEEYS
jgi:hypothetical protein